MALRQTTTQPALGQKLIANFEGILRGALTRAACVNAHIDRSQGGIFIRRL